MIAIIDYGLGNIKAFVNVYDKLNIPVIVARKSEDLRKSSKIILPGVGAFDHAMTLLNNSGLRNTLNELILGEKIPILGVCVGMQILSESSEEGALPGLGWISGRVKRFDFSKYKTTYPLPHMGWNNINIDPDNELFKDFGVNQRFYFLHSYYFECSDKKNSIAETSYGYNFTCAVNYKNIFGVQFHPEKSHHSGVQVLKNFGKM